jgi:hypothetical protein
VRISSYERSLSNIWFFKVLIVLARHRVKLEPNNEAVKAELTTSPAHVIPHHHLPPKPTLSRSSVLVYALQTFPLLARVHVPRPQPRNYDADHGAARRDGFQDIDR